MPNIKEKLADVPVIGSLLRIQERFGEIGGTALANGIALQGFLSLIPLMLVAIATAGFLASGDTNFTSDVIDAFGLPPDGTSAENLTEAIDSARESRRAASVTGVLGLLWSGLAVIAALQRAIDRAWQTKAEGLKDKLRAVLWLLGAGVIFMSSFALSALLNFVPGFVAPLSVVLGLAVDVGLFLWTFTELGRVPVGWRALLPGALVCAIGFEILKLLGTLYVPRLIANSSALYGSLGVVVAILAWLALFGRLVVYGAVVNVLRWESAHGTLKIPVEAPRIDNAIALEADRAGAVTDRLEEVGTSR